MAQSWTFDSDGGLFRLASEAYRIHLAHLFDPYLAVHCSLLEHLPHQITAVYGEMLPRQPLRFLLADDPGAGKTIMAGLLIKELMIRADIERCLIVAPGNLVEQWQAELAERFAMQFAILTRERIEASLPGNPFSAEPLLIARLDMLSRRPDLQEKLQQAEEWDLVVCDEAHRMSASVSGQNIKYTKRYRLGRQLSKRCRHFLLMTATPHNGKEEDFQIFMSLLDEDRFEGSYRNPSTRPRPTDLMRRLSKEQLLRFDGTPLFPERLAKTVSYELSPEQKALYEEVTDYVKTEMNRADNALDGNDKRKNNIGFALQILQRRLASSPRAIHRSLRRRRERLEERLAEERRGPPAQQGRLISVPFPAFDDLDELEEAPESELEEAEAIADQSTAARTIAELKAEIETLRSVEERAEALLRSGSDSKWEQLDSILNDPLMKDEHSNRRKLIVFTESRDTLEYLAEKIRQRLGRAEAVAVIHGGVSREARRAAVESFTNDKEVIVLVANDAAGEGINLQRASLMVNYDLPWNPNRLEQRFGRIHRIGQTEVCHLWNLVAGKTREGAVFLRLLEKLETARASLGGQVYDVLGELFHGRPLRQLLMDAIRYGERAEAQKQQFEAVDRAMGPNLQKLLQESSLIQTQLADSTVHEVRLQMERAAARRLQPHFIRSFFIEAFRHLGGSILRREAGRWEITRVPAALRQRGGHPVAGRYERVCFDKKHLAGPPAAAFLCPGHPLLDATIALTLEQNRGLLSQGALLVDNADQSSELRALYYLEHAIQDGRPWQHGPRRIISQRLQFVEIGEKGAARDAGPAPYLDYRPVTPAERAILQPLLQARKFPANFEQRAHRHAEQHNIPEHLAEVKKRRLSQIAAIEGEVKHRLNTEIQYWDRQASKAAEKERRGIHAKPSAANARERADDLEIRRNRRFAELQQERDITALPPTLCGGAIIVPAGLLAAQTHPPEQVRDSAASAEIEQAAMRAVMEAERRLGYQPTDVSAKKVGYDIESLDPRSGHLRFIEVKGRVEGAKTITVTRNEILTALSQPEGYILAVVEVVSGSGFATPPRYIRRPFRREPDFGAASVNYKLSDLYKQATGPS